MKVARSPLLLVLLVSGSLQIVACPVDSLTDSSKTQNATLKSQIKINARLQSLGVFGYGGMIANTNPGFDVSLNYSRKHWGLFVFKAFDLYDGRSPYNFMLAMVNKPFHLSRQLTFTPNFGFVVEQCRSIADKDSDGVVFLITSYKLNHEVTFEHCARFSNTVLETQYFDWLNRFKLSYLKNHIDLSVTTWHNNNIFDDTKHTSVGGSVGYGKIPIAKHLQLSTMITAIKMVANTDKEELHAGSGISFSVFVTFLAQPN